ncbi:MAG: hypothetical protein QOG22_4035 [Pseudonocardiales bacterium]|jgi:hypothetical protein|nr:hypothetical protein [Pseudonocardiales bacterium]MDT4975622.1 hypothetical protein [Pseudonocardiales bacterium]
MATFESAELVELFMTYTASPTSIGAHLAAASARQNTDDPLIVATGTDIALYLGGGQPPVVEGFRVSTRGFKELAAVSHLGPALATLVRLRELGEANGWRQDAERLLSATKAARAANSTELWRDRIAVRAFHGREATIAAMVDYSCRLTERFLQRSLDDPGYLNTSTLQEDYLEGPADELPVPFNRIMIATFFLTGMDVAHRLISWFDDLELPWERAMVIIAGRAGRPTAGVTRESNSVAGVINTASRGRLPAHRLLIAPHAPVFPLFDGTDLEPTAALEGDYRRMFASLQATSELGAQMFDSYPRFHPNPDEDVRVHAESLTVHAKPAIDGPDDWLALTTRLRVVMEDPRQLLSGAVTDYASRQLAGNGNDPAALTVPGLDREPYPGLDVSGS